MGLDEQVRVKGWSVPKAGEERNSDRWRWSRRTGKVAIADGATVSSYSGRWADILVRGFVWYSLDCVDDRNAFAEHITRLQQQWHDAVPWTYLEKKGWNYILKAQQGAHATFLGVRLCSETWTACAVGDSTLFLVDDDGETLLTWPSGSDAEFDNYPDLIPSLSVQPLWESISRMEQTEGSLAPATNLVLCTDALAAYLLRHQEDTTLWRELLSVRNSGISAYERLVQRLRQDGMKNDDTTTVIVHRPHE